MLFVYLECYVWASICRCYVSGYMSVVSFCVLLFLNFTSVVFCFSTKINICSRFLAVRYFFAVVSRTVLLFLLTRSCRRFFDEFYRIKVASCSSKPQSVRCCTFFADVWLSFGLYMCLLHPSHFISYELVGEFYLALLHLSSAPFSWRLSLENNCRWTHTFHTRDASYKNIPCKSTTKEKAQERQTSTDSGLFVSQQETSLNARL